MKKMINVAIYYTIAALVCGVFFREFTKLNHFVGTTALGKVHAHLLLLGMIVFLIVSLFMAHTKLGDEKQFKAFFVIYNIGVPLTAVMMLVRGTFQVLAVELSVGANAAISGVAGIGHILTGTGLVLLLLAIKKVAKN